MCKQAKMMKLAFNVGEKLTKGMGDVHDVAQYALVLIKSKQ